MCVLYILTISHTTFIKVKNKQYIPYDKSTPEKFTMHWTQTKEFIE